MYDHIGLKVKGLDAAVRFYSAALAPLGFARLELTGMPLWARSLLVQLALAVALAIPGIRRLRAPQKELVA